LLFLPPPSRLLILPSAILERVRIFVNKKLQKKAGFSVFSFRFFSQKKQPPGRKNGFGLVIFDFAFLGDFWGGQPFFCFAGTGLGTTGERWFFVCWLSSRLGALARTKSHAKKPRPQSFWVKKSSYSKRAIPAGGVGALAVPFSVTNNAKRKTKNCL
jgi:hypothetical protein